MVLDNRQKGSKMEYEMQAVTPLQALLYFQEVVLISTEAGKIKLNTTQKAVSGIPASMKIEVKHNSLHSFTKYGFF